ncbi:hypothetical protein BKA62DRAFT_588274, partial [Auriculariales sp. MPI-PUGE-AT-0066]
IRLRIRVQPGASRTELKLAKEPAEEAPDGDQILELTARVTARACGGHANDAVILLLAEELDVSRSHVALVRGEKSRDKIFSIIGLNRGDILSRL